MSRRMRSTAKLGVLLTHREMRGSAFQVSGLENPEAVEQLNTRLGQYDHKLTKTTLEEVITMWAVDFCAHGTEELIGQLRPHLDKGYSIMFTEIPASAS